jgi:hypothetical protein
MAKPACEFDGRELPTAAFESPRSRPLEGEASEHGDSTAPNSLTATEPGKPHLGKPSSQPPDTRLTALALSTLNASDGESAHGTDRTPAGGPSTGTSQAPSNSCLASCTAHSPEHTFSLRVTLWGNLQRPNRGWVNYGLFDVDVNPTTVNVPYNAIQTCLNLHEPTADCNRQFYIWPGPEYCAPIRSGATLMKRLRVLLLSGYTWAHISIKPGESHHLRVDADGRFLVDEGHCSKRPAPIGLQHNDAASSKRAKHGNHVMIDSPPSSNASTPSNKGDSPPTTGSSTESSDNNENVDDASTSASPPYSAVDEILDYVSISSDNSDVTKDEEADTFAQPVDNAASGDPPTFLATPIDMMNVSACPLRLRTRSDDVHLQEILDAQAEAVAALKEDGDEEPTDDENANELSGGKKRNGNDQSDLEKVRLTEKMKLDVVDRATASHMERIDLDDWLRACAFWGVDQTAFTQAKPINLQHTFWDLPQPASPAQLHEAWAMYMQETTECNGGIFANMMGLGKTRTMVLMLVVGHAHLVNKLAVWAEWQSSVGPKDHLPSTALPGSRCPTAGDRPFACSCEPGSDFNRKAPRTALTYLSGAARSTKAWITEIAMNILKTKWCDGEQVHPPMRFCWVASPTLIDERPEIKRCFAEPTELELMEMRCKIDYGQALRKHQDSRDWTRSYKANKQEYTESPEWMYQNGTPQNHVDSSEDRPSPSAGRFILIVNYAGIQTRFQQLMSVSVNIVREIHYHQGVKDDNRSILIPGKHVVIGRTMLDEFHLAKNCTTLMSKVYQTLRESGNHGYQWKSWVLSGTPLEAGLAEVLTFVSLALPGIPTVRHPNGNWKNREGGWKHAEYSRLANNSETASPLEAPGLCLAKAWTALLTKCGSNKIAADKVMTSASYRELIDSGPWILRRWVFWRTWETKDPWGHRIGGIDSDFDTCFQPCRLPRTKDGLGYEESVTRMSAQALRHVTGYVGRSAPCHLPSAFASFPYLAKTMADVPEMLNTTKLQHLVSIADTLAEKNPFVHHLAPLLNTSSKYQFVRRECNNIKQERQGSHQDTARKRGKILLGSRKPVCQMLLYLGLSREFGRESVTYLPGGLSGTDSSERIRQWRKPDGPWILVASVQAYAESVTLVEAHTVILLEPQTRMNQQLQFACRILRKGQQVKLCKGFVLYNPEAETEQRLLMKQLFKTKASASLTAAGVAGDDVLTNDESWSWDWDSDDAVLWRIPGMALPEPQL